MRLSKWGVITCGIYLGLNVFILTRYIPWDNLGSITWDGMALMVKNMPLVLQYTGLIGGVLLSNVLPQSFLTEHEWVTSWPMMHAISYIVLYFIGRFAEWFYVRLNEG